jgi:hypothetical protein
MKKTTKEHPITFFRKATEARNKTFKTALKKAQDGISVGPYEKGTSEYLDARYPGTAMKFKGPVDPTYEADQRDKVANTSSFGYGNPSDLEKFDREQEEKGMRSPNMRSSFNSGMGLSKSDAYKKGGAVKKPMMKKGGSVKKMQDGGKVIKTKETVNRYSSQRTPEFVKGDRTTYANEPSDAAQYGKIKEKKDILGRKVIKTPYTETQASGRKSTGTVTDKFNRQGQLKKTVNKSSVTSANGTQYKAKDVTKVEGKMKKGGAVKNAKLAALAAPKNKITRADIIVGAKRKKK